MNTIDNIKTVEFRRSIIIEIIKVRPKLKSTIMFCSLDKADLPPPFRNILSDG